MKIGNKEMNQSKKIEQAFKEYLEEYISYGFIVTIPIDIEFIGSFGGITGTYFLYSKNKIIYVGVSSYIGNRILTHLKNNNHNSFGDEVDEIKIVRFKTWEEAVTLEETAINKFHPKNNKNIPPIGNYLYQLSEKEKKQIIKTIDKIVSEIKK